jgi:hypothetical protein
LFWLKQSESYSAVISFSSVLTKSNLKCHICTASIREISEYKGLTGGPWRGSDRRAHPAGRWGKAEGSQTSELNF